MALKKLNSSGVRSRRPKGVVIEIPCIPDHGEAAKFLKNLIRVIERNPSRIILRFLSGSVISPDTALSAYELLGGAKRLRIEAEAVSCIIGPALILFLLAETRTMRKTGFLFFPNETRPQKNRTRELLRDAEAWKEESEDQEPDPHGWVHEVHRQQIASMRSIIQRHVSWPDVTCKPMSFEMASDYGLLGGNPLTAYLDHLEAGALRGNQTSPASAPGRQSKPE